MHGNALHMQVANTRTHKHAIEVKSRQTNNSNIKNMEQNEHLGKKCYTLLQKIVVQEYQRGTMEYAS